MKNSLIKFLLAGIIGATFCSCEKDIDLVYTSDSSIYFKLRDDELATGTIPYVYRGNVTFAYATADVQDSIYKIPVNVLGRASDTPRPFKVIAIASDSLTTAKEGVHFQILDDSCYIPAHSISGYAYIRLLRTADMQDSIFKMRLLLVGNDYFNADYIYEIYRGSGNSYYTTQFNLTVTDELTAPATWKSAVVNNFGGFTRTKAYAICDYFGLDFYSDIVQDANGFMGNTTYISSMGIAFRNYLLAQNDAGTPVLDPQSGDSKGRMTLGAQIGPAPGTQFKYPN